MEIDVQEFQEEGYQPIVDFMEWRVAVLKYCEELEIDQIFTMQKHVETDEVFVLLEGSCTLFTAGDSDGIRGIKAWEMEPLKTYNVKKGVWHTHTLAKNTSVLIVENRNTCDLNSPTIRLTKEEKMILKNINTVEYD